MKKKPIAHVAASRDVPLGQRRKGKTFRDRSSGAHARCIQNKIARAAWQQAQHSDRKEAMSTFPWRTCNGKKNRQGV